MRARLGLFSGLVCVGSVAGAVSWGTQLSYQNLLYESNGASVSRQIDTLLASALRFAAVSLITYGFELLCLILSKLVLLRLLVDSATQSSQADVSGMSGVRRRWLGGRALQIVYKAMASGVVAGGVVCLVMSAVACAYSAQQAVVVDQAASACDAAGNDTNSSLALINAANAINTNSNTVGSVQAGIEALTLLLITISYAFIVSWSVALFRIVERVGALALLSSNDRRDTQPSESSVEGVVAAAVQSAVKNRRRLTAACLVVLITFPARAAFDLLQAYSSFNDPQNATCGPCDPCQSNSFLINQWLTYTPEFQPIVVAVSSPLPLTLSLWLMTKTHARAQQSRVILSAPLLIRVFTLMLLLICMRAALQQHANPLSQTSCCYSGAFRSKRPYVHRVHTSNSEAPTTTPKATAGNRRTRCNHPSTATS